MELTQSASAGDTVIVINCYVVGLQVGSIITLNEATYERWPPAQCPPAGAASPRNCQSRWLHH